MTCGLQADILTDKVQKKDDSFNSGEILQKWVECDRADTDWYFKRLRNNE